MVWTAAKGLATEKHAKAQADYAKAENDRIDAELRRRTLESRTRTEVASADKAKAEAGIAKVREIQARIELFKQLKELGVNVTLDDSGIMQVWKGVVRKDAVVPAELLNAEEHALLEAAMVDVVVPVISDDLMEEDFVLSRWIRQVGQTVEIDEALYEIDTPMVITEVPLPAAGVLAKIIHLQGSMVRTNM